MQDKETLEMALRGYEIQVVEIQNKISEIRGWLDIPDAPTIQPMPKRKVHYISAAGRARISAAQKRRWARSRKQA